MILFPTKGAPCWPVLLVILFLGLPPLAAAPMGPTLHFDYGRGNSASNPLLNFMYFVPLISPEPVAVFTNAGNTQCARVLSLQCRTNGVFFSATCEFEMAGAGVERNVFDKTTFIQSHDTQLKSGKIMTHQLAAINVEGSGRGSLEVEGILTNGEPAVTEVRLRFDGRGRRSPVTVVLEDLACRDGVMRHENEMVARVNQLAFRQQAGKPEMEVTLASVKAKEAGDGFWQNLVGGLKGMAANLFLPPLRVAADGHEAMMNFGLALALEKPVFTFPLAVRLEGAPTRIRPAGGDAKN